MEVYGFKERVKYFRGLRLLMKAHGNVTKLVEDDKNSLKQDWGKLIWFEIQVNLKLFIS